MNGDRSKIVLLVSLLVVAIVIGYEAVHYGLIYPGPDFDPLLDINFLRTIGDLDGYNKLGLTAGTMPGSGDNSIMISLCANRIMLVRCVDNDSAMIEYKNNRNFYLKKYKLREENTVDSFNTYYVTEPLKDPEIGDYSVNCAMVKRNLFISVVAYGPKLSDWTEADEIIGKVAVYLQKKASDK